MDNCFVFKISKDELALPFQLAVAADIAELTLVVGREHVEN